ncbi:MAG: O-antigen ligase family protein, partial [Planctomycetes bacterium]|nr:O-antigen ligase family protein [Planctomycetota bacterium]
MISKGLIFTYALTYGGAVAAVVNPFYGLLIYIAFAIIKPPAFWSWSVSPGNYSRIIAIAMLIGWAYHGFGRWDFGRAKGILLAFFGFIAWGALSTLIAATDQTLAWVAVEELAKVFLPFLVGLTIIDSVSKLKTLAWVILLSQSFLAYEVNVSYFVDGFNRMAQMGIVGIDNNVASIAMATAAGLAFFLSLDADKLWQRALAAVCGVLLVHAVLMSDSRGGMLALVCTAVVSFVLLPKKPKHYVLFAAALLISLRLAGPDARERFTTTFVESEERDTSAQSRVDLWADCWDVMQKRPLFGLGPNHWPLTAQEYGWPEGKIAHSTWIQTGAEWGIPGMVFLVAIYVLCMARMWPLARLRVPEHSAAAFQPLVGRVVL